MNTLDHPLQITPNTYRTTQILGGPRPRHPPVQSTDGDSKQRPLVLAGHVRNCRRGNRREGHRNGIAHSIFSEQSYPYYNSGQNRIFDHPCATLRLFFFYFLNSFSDFHRIPFLKFRSSPRKTLENIQSPSCLLQESRLKAFWLHNQ